MGKERQENKKITSFGFYKINIKLKILNSATL